MHTLVTDRKEPLKALDIDAWTVFAERRDSTRDLSVSETHTVAQIQLSYKEIKSPSSRWHKAISPLCLTENSWPQWPRENGNQALRKAEKPFSLAPSSQLWGSWPIVQNHHLLFALNFRSKAVISPLFPPTLFFYIIIIIFFTPLLSNPIVLGAVSVAFVLSLSMKLRN